LRQPEICFNVRVKLAAHEAFTLSVPARARGFGTRLSRADPEGGCEPTWPLGKYCPLLPERYPATTEGEILSSGLGDRGAARGARGRRYRNHGSADVEAWRGRKTDCSANTLCPSCHASRHRRNHGSSRSGRADPRSRFGNGRPPLSGRTPPLVGSLLGRTPKKEVTKLPALAYEQHSKKPFPFHDLDK
jgi:hypothetical protein